MGYRGIPALPIRPNHLHVGPSSSGWSVAEFANSSTALHTIIHELLRLSTLPLITPSPISGFHSSFYLGLGWGIAETTWGIIQGWEQLALYEDLMLLEEGVSITVDDGSREDVVGGGGLLMSPDIMEREDEADLERKVEILERMRERRGGTC